MAELAIVVNGKVVAVLPEGEVMTERPFARAVAPGAVRVGDEWGLAELAAQREAVRTELIVKAQEARTAIVIAINSARSVRELGEVRARAIRAFNGVWS